MIDFLTLVIVGIALLQPTTDRKIVAMIFASLTFIHNEFLYGLEGLLYYDTDALFYIIIISAIGFVNSKSQLIDDLQKISIAAVALDYFGWFIWMAYMPPTGYNVAFMALYAWTIFILLRGEPKHDGSTEMDRRHHSILSNAYSRHIINNQH